MIRFLSVIYLLVCLIFWVGIPAVRAAEKSPLTQESQSISDSISASSGTREKEPININQINTDLNNIETVIRQNTISHKGSQDYIKQLNFFQEELSEERKQNNAQLENLAGKISSLNALTSEGEVEPEDITKQREELLKSVNDVKSKIAAADMALLKIDEINQLILKFRNQNLLDQILVKRDSILHWRTFVTSIKNFAVFLYGIGTYPKTWYEGLSVEQQTKVFEQLNRIILFAIFGIVFILLISHFIKKKLGYRKDIEKPTYPQKVYAAFFMMLARGILPATIIGVCWLWLRAYQELFSGTFGTVLRIGMIYILYLFLSCSSVAVLFTPLRPKWRLIEVNDEKAKSLTSALILSIIMICVFSYFQVLAIQLEYSDDVIFSLKILANIVKAGAIILVSYRFLYNDRELSDEELKNDDEVQQLSTSSKVSLFLCMLTLIVLSFSLFGYVMLTEYIFNRFIASVLIVGVFYIIQKLLVVLFHQFMTMKFWMRELRINHKQTEKYEFWFGFLLTPFLTLMCIFILLALWGVSVDILGQKLKKFLTGFDIGGMHVSITSIIAGIIAFFITLFISKKTKSSLTNGKLSKIEMDSSVRNSLAAGIGFVGIVVSCLIGISVMGGSLKGLALVAGALSIGAGLGLQNIVNNFVSGFILLFERPIKIGDWVIINGNEGVVKQVNIRSTVIETFNRADIIIPNADILSNNLTNMTYRNKTGRIVINVGVGYESDVTQVESVLLDIAKNTKGILSVPSPFVRLEELADSSLNFTLYAYISDVNNRAAVSSTVRKEIINRFRAENINIPFPQRVVYLHTEANPVEINIKKES